MEFLKKLGRSLFGSSRSSTPKKSPKRKAQGAKKKGAKASQTKKKTVKKTARNTAKKVAAKAKPSKKKKAQAKKQPAMVKRALAALPMAEVTHYFPHVNAAVLKIKTGMIRIGDELHFKGHTTDFRQKVSSMQIDHRPVAIAKKGDDFGLQVKTRVRAGDLVYKK
ncbi:MAG TPA: hypothetical protein PLL75_07875 [Candidatus Omnitrophota bacterium]|nr:hypothetical protein [Candidatus Omnitrophota bacterium]HPS37624.1 hypothetical protein [Candidatus Omnitrophota bacterium]